MVPHLVTEKQNTPVLARKKPGTKDRVGLLVQENLDQFQQIQGVILEIGVMRDGELCCRALERRADRGSLALVDLMPQEHPLHLRVGFGADGTLELTEDRRGLVGRAVIDNDNLN